MYAIEFETEINGKYIEIKDFERLANKHARVIILVDEPVADGSNDKLAAFDAYRKQRSGQAPVDQGIDVDQITDDMNSDLF